jgi:hypothetical protein
MVLTNRPISLTELTLSYYYYYPKGCMALHWARDSCVMDPSLSLCRQKEDLIIKDGRIAVLQGEIRGHTAASRRIETPRLIISSSVFVRCLALQLTFACYSQIIPSHQYTSFKRWARTDDGLGSSILILCNYASFYPLEIRPSPESCIAPTFSKLI